MSKKHKVSINVPDDAQVKKLVAEALEEEPTPLEEWWEALRDNFCGFLYGAGDQLGCGASEQNPVGSGLCNLLNTILESVGCDPIEPEPEPECIVDEDCIPSKECIENVCVPRANYCETEEDCQSYENCVDNQCVDDEEHCHNAGCEEYQYCDENTGDCELEMDRCENNEDCIWDVSEQVCKVEEHECVECLQWEDCNPSGGEECTGNSCVSCPPVGSSCVQDEDCCSYMSCNLDFNQCILP